MTSILITGATGFIGEKIFNFLKSKGFVVYGTSMIEESNPDIFKVDITKSTDLKKIPKNIDIILHLAAVREVFGSDAENEKMCLKVNVEGSRNVAKFAAERGATHFIYISSSTIYDKSKREIKEDDLIKPKTHYGHSKYLGEVYCQKVCAKSGVHITILRLSSVFGPSQKQFLIPYILECIQDNKNIVLYGTGEGKWDLLYVKDLLDVILKVIKDKIYGTYNIGSKKLVSVKEIAEIALSVFNGSKSKIVYDAQKEENKQNTVLDTSKAEEKFGLKIKYDIRKALEDLKKEMEKKE